MLLQEPSTFRRILAFDYGLKRTGVAVGQEASRTSEPVGVVTCSHGAPDWGAIGALIDEWRPDLLVIGIPTQADGKLNNLGRAALRFANDLGQRFALDVETVDERLSSYAAADRLQSSASGKRKRSRRAAIDPLAACVILESWFDKG